SRIRRFVRLSSTTRTLIPRKILEHLIEASPTGWVVAVPRRMVKLNLDPVPISLSTQIVPPISSTRRLEMLKPSPVPPDLRVVDESTCVNMSKIVGKKDKSTGNA